MASIYGSASEPVVIVIKGMTAVVLIAKECKTIHQRRGKHFREEVAHEEL